MKFKTIAAVIAVCLAATVYAVAVGVHPAYADIVQSTQWNCTSAQSGTNVTINFPASGDAVIIKPNCTGYINSITAYLTRGDGIHFGSTTGPLEIGSIHIYQFGHDVGAHQDGLQCLSASNVTVDGGYVGGYSANDAQAMMHPATQTGTGCQNVLIKNVIFDPSGLGATGSTDPLAKDPTLAGCSPGDPGVCGSVATALGTAIPAHAGYYWGNGGAYGLSNGLSVNSGYQCVTLTSLSNLHDLYQGPNPGGPTGPIWSFDTSPGLPTGVRDNFGEAWSMCDNTPPPSQPGAISVTDGSQATQVPITWPASTDNIAVTGYHVTLDSVAQADASTNSTTVTGLTWGTHTITVQAFDAAGNTSPVTTKTITSSWG